MNISSSGDSYRIQTCNLLIRSQMLYSVELRNHFALKVSPFLLCKVNEFFSLYKLYWNIFQNFKLTEALPIMPAIGGRFFSILISPLFTSG